MFPLLVSALLWTRKLVGFHRGLRHRCDTPRRVFRDSCGAIFRVTSRGFPIFGTYGRKSSGVSSGGCDKFVDANAPGFSVGISSKNCDHEISWVSNAEFAALLYIRKIMGSQSELRHCHEREACRFRFLGSIMALLWVGQLVRYSGEGGGWRGGVLSPPLPAGGGVFFARGCFFCPGLDLYSGLLIENGTKLFVVGQFFSQTYYYGKNYFWLSELYYWANYTSFTRLDCRKHRCTLQDPSRSFPGTFWGSSPFLQGLVWFLAQQIGFQKSAMLLKSGAKKNGFLRIYLA